VKRPRVLVADDHQKLMDALKCVLEPRCEVVGTVNDGRALVAAASALQPDPIVLDIAMPGLNGLDAARRLKQSESKAKLIFLTMHEDPDFVGEAFRAGASAFLLKQSAVLELTDAVEKCLGGGSYVTPGAAKPQARENAAEPTLR
jgi:DNA-binding NarL/FixJ family response regulator